MGDVADRRRRAALAGHAGDPAAARALLHDPDPAVRATALGALGRLGAFADTELAAALADPIAAVRRRACQVAVGAAEVDLVPLLTDPDAGVVEVAAWALGERADAGGGVVDALARVAAAHDDALCREAAVAALGAIGDDRGLPAVLAAAEDRPAVRRRAVIALAAFTGPAVEAAIGLALKDRDWQVRQAAEDLQAAGGDLPLGAHEEDLQ